MEIGVVILNYNDYNTTIGLLSKIKSYKSIKTIIVVDNSSTDNSYQVLLKFTSKFPSIKLIQAKKNGGYSYGNNLGLKYLLEKGVDIAIVANPDIIFEEDVIKRIKQELEDDPQIGLITPMMHNCNDQPMRMWLKLPTYFNAILDCSLIGRQINKLLGRVKIDYSHPLMEVEKIPGSFMAFRTEALKSIGLFDENVFLYYEENIIGEKLRKTNYKSVIITDLSYIHNHSITISKNLSIIKIYKNNLKSKMYFEKTYHKIGPIRAAILSTLMSYGVFEKKIIIKLEKLL